MKAETLLAHAGYDSDESTGSVIPPIHLSTTFQRDTAGEYAHGFVYSRAANPTRRQFEALMTQLEGGAGALAFSSGMAACSGIFSCLEPGSRVLIPEDLYYGVRKVLTDVFSRWDVEFATVDMTDLAAVEMELGARCDLVWIETPSNPMLDIVDISAVADLARRTGSTVVVDGTWTTPLLQRPLEMGAHAVVHSVTKYLSGHSDVLGGVVVTASDFPWGDRLESVHASYGAVLDPFSCWLAMRGLRTLAVRLASQCHNAFALATHLAAHQNVVAVYYPGLAFHPGHDVATRQMSAFGGMLSFEVDGDEHRARDVVNRCRVFKRATSLGGTESLIEHRASIEENSTAPGALIRVSAGIEHTDDLLHDLLHALG